ncbi:MAG: sigma-70 family RNA polymerase sigma factor [Smithella sp.]|nr:sigma-70 family RNA polymerase sigma factor [Smithella sp.]
MDIKKAATDEDWEFVALCQQGDTEAFEVLVERHQKKMLNIAYRMTGNYDEACDVTQEAFVAAYKSIRKFKAESKFSTWLYRIVINYSKNRLKQLRGRERRESFSLDDSTKIKGTEISGQSSAQESDPGMRMERREREAQVQQCINKLDEEYRDVLVLRDIQGFSYEEIKAILNIPDGTVKSRLSRARNALKNCLLKVMGDL